MTRNESREHCGEPRPRLDVTASVMSHRLYTYSKIFFFHRVLPSYSDLLPSPSYSCQPANGEQRLDYTPRSRASRLRPSAVFIKTSGPLCVVLNGQEEDAAIPVFGRRTTIDGTVLCQGPLDKIRKIVLKVEGRLDSVSSIGGSHSTKLIDDCYTLWSHEPSQEPCLPQVPFSITLPSTFQDGDTSSPLPPSFYFNQHDTLNLLVRSVYQFRFIVTSIRHHKLDIWPKTQNIIIPFNYVPRTRASRPIVPTSCLFSSVKSSPEEWYQAVTYLKMRPNVKMSPIICNLFVPAGRIYGLTDTMKFHVQLAGLTCSLYALFSGMDQDRITDDPARRKPRNQKPLISVNLLRQVSAMIRGENGWSNIILGEGNIWPIPPDISSCCDTCGGHCDDSIDWEGELRCNSDVTVGGFTAANVQVKDFIVLSIPSPTPTSPLLELNFDIPVRLVTDSFLDILTQMDSTAV